MSIQTVTSANIMCCMGSAPASLTVLPTGCTNANGMPAATVKDSIPIVNIPPFGTCICPGNPMFIAATAAAMGVPTPVPCVPLTVGPWAPGSPTVTIGGAPALNNASTLQCAWGGVITIMSPGQSTVMVA